MHTQSQAYTRALLGPLHNHVMLKMAVEMFKELCYMYPDVSKPMRNILSEF